MRLNRPKALNALTLEMVHAIDGALDAFDLDSSIGLVIIESANDRGFCAGGDIRGLYDSIKAGGNLGRSSWCDEYQLNSRLASYRKPFVAFMDGIVMGGGVGVSAHGRHRIVTEKTKWRYAAEVGIVFSMSAARGCCRAHRANSVLDHALTGAQMNGADAIRAGFADVFIASEKLPGGARGAEAPRRRPPA
ncbi:MAG: enoyl-CoA hydratase/isomerase family protein [Nibricoccus sp.]